MGSIVLNQSINCLCGGVRLYLALRKSVRQVSTVGYFRSQLQNKVMPDYTSTHQKIQLSPAMYHPIYQNRQLKDLKMIQFHRDQNVLQMNTKEACKLLKTYSMAAVYGKRNRNSILSISTIRIVDISN